MYANAEVEKWTQRNVKAEGTLNSLWVHVNSALVFFLDQNSLCWDRNHSLTSKLFAFWKLCCNFSDLQYLQNWYFDFDFNFALRACVHEAFPMILARGHRMYLFLRASFACIHRTQGTFVGKTLECRPLLFEPRCAGKHMFTSRTFMRLLITQIE